MSKKTKTHEQAQQTPSETTQKESTSIEVRGVEKGSVQEQNLATVQAENLIAQAINKGVDVATMERLLAMRTQLKAEAAKEAFDNDMASLQGELPTIKKTKSVPTKSGKIAYSYAPIESIVEQTRELIKKYGFSYQIKTEMIKDEKNLTTGVKSVCIVKHRFGHSEESPMEVPLGTKTDVMSASQVVAAASTFSKRYAFCNAFGIMTGDDDDDSNSTKDSMVSVDEKVLAILEKISKDTRVDTMEVFNEKVQKSPKYSAEQKKIINDAIRKRIAEVVPPANENHANA